MPDLVGPVRFILLKKVKLSTDSLLLTGTIVVVLQLCLRFVDVFNHGQRGREAGATNRYIEWTRGTV